MRKKKQFTAVENENNQALKEMFHYVDTAGFAANVIVIDEEGSILFEGSALRIELLIDMGIKFDFVGQTLQSYQQLGLRKKYELKEASMVCNSSKGHNTYFTIKKELEIKPLNSGMTIIIEPQ